MIRKNEIVGFDHHGYGLVRNRREKCTELHMEAVFKVGNRLWLVYNPQKAYECLRPIPLDQLIHDRLGITARDLLVIPWRSETSDEQRPSCINLRRHCLASKQAPFRWKRLTQLCKTQTTRACRRLHSVPCLECSFRLANQRERQMATQATHTARFSNNCKITKASEERHRSLLGPGSEPGKFKPLSSL